MKLGMSATFRTPQIFSRENAIIIIWNSNRRQAGDHYIIDDKLGNICLANFDSELPFNELLGHCRVQ